MLSVALLSLLVPTVGAMNVTSSSALLQQGDPPVEIWVNKTDARLGDRVKVHARTDMDGYLLILHAEPDGRIRILFPIDPVYDNFVRGGDRFEVIGRGDREAFRVYSASGTGTVYAAYSRDPFRFEGFTRSNHWDYGQPDTWWVLDDAEADLTNLASQMAGGAYFDYDFLEYNVWDATVASSGSATNITYYGSTPYYSPWSFGVGFYWGWGPSYYPYSYYWDRWYWRTRYYYGWYPYSWYNDWYYGGYYDWYYPYRYSYYYGHYPPRYYGGYTTPVVYGDTHLRYRPRLTASNSDTRARRAYVPTTSAGRVAAASSASATTRGVTGSGRRTMPQVTGRTATTERTTASTQRGVSSARRVTGVSSQPAQSSSSSRTATARRTTSRTQVAPSRTQTSGSQASPTRTPTSRSTATVRRTPTAGSQPSQPTRSTARAAPAPRTSVRQPVQRSQPSASNRSAVRTNPAPSRSTPVRATPSAPARTPAARPAPTPSASRPSAPSASRPSAPSASRPSAPSASRPSAPSVSRPSAPSQPSSSSSRPSSSSSSSSRPRKP